MNATVTLAFHPQVRETAILHMLETLRETVAKEPEDSIDARVANVLIDIMPGFFRSLDKERIRFVWGVRNERAQGLDPQQSKALDEFLQVMTMPLINMVTSALMTVVPCDHEQKRCRCSDLRFRLFTNVMDNLRVNVIEGLRRPRGAHANGREF